MKHGLLLTGQLLLCWLLMQIVHEAGHAAAALLSGGHIQAVHLHPLQISMTEVSPNPHPLIVCWAGPGLGALLPIFMWLGIPRRFVSAREFLQLLAGFCLIANGLYLGTALWTPVGDAVDLLTLGMPKIVLALAGWPAVVAGLVVWNGFSVHWKARPSKECELNRRVLTVWIGLAALIAVEMFCSWLLRGSH